MRDGAIEVEHLWKRFRADKRRRVRLSDWVAGGRRPRRTTGGDRWRWVLRDISLRVEPGESVGLIGLNGSGKSTFLKILNQVMYPNYGSVKVGGRVGALIAIQAGIHPELSGRENILLYGSLLGFRRSEVARRFDDIVDFAEIGDAVDRQVKFYSSGMSMRMGFAVAALLEPDVLLVDEVLAVGDATFQQRCLDRMRQLLGQGTTLILVSHDLVSVEAMCRRGVWLNGGVVAADGPMRDVLHDYRAVIERSAERDSPPGEGLAVTDVSVRGPHGALPRSQEALEIDVSIKTNQQIEGTLWLGVTEGTASPFLLFRHELDVPEGQSQVVCRLPALPLPSGTFYVWGGLTVAREQLLQWRPLKEFDVEGPALAPAPTGVTRLAPLIVDADWDIRR